MTAHSTAGRHATTRRRFLRASAAAGALVGAEGVAGAQSQPQEIRLGGEIAGWQGQAPESIAGKSNPTLQFAAGTTYRVVWENLDGRGHNFALLDSNGDVLQRTEVMNEQGATQTIEFTASEAMAEYVCEPHITSMHGSISFGEGTTTRTTTEGGESGDSGSYFGDGPTVRIETLTEGTLTAPLDYAKPAGGERTFIADRLGQVYAYESGSLNDEPFIDVSGKLTEITGEMGLLGMAFHPSYGENGKFYLRYSAPSREGTPEEYSHTEVLSEFTASDDGKGQVDSERTLLEVPSPRNTHNAGAVVFGPDGLLYVAMGDGGGAHDTGTGHVSDWYERNEGGNGQDVTENLLGSILRIDVDSRDGDKPYGIPDDNPLVGRTGLDEQFAWGFRNPWRMGFSDGKLFASDVGQNGFEEIDIVRKDKNYGWNVREGTHCFKPGPEGSRNPPEECPSKLPSDVRGGERLIPPIIEYPHAVDGEGVGSAAIGGYLYGRDDIPALNGKYVFGDFRKTQDTETPTGSLLAATPSEGDGLWDVAELSIENTDSGFVGGYILAMGRDNEGRLYVLTTANPGSEATGAVHRIVPPKQAQRTTGTTATGNTTAGNATATPAANSTATGTNSTATNATATNATTAPTANVTATDTSAATPTATDGTTPTATEEPQTTGEGGVSAGTSSDSGPGFGVLAALSGLTIGAARLLAGRED
jgi:glucose/arabinose dehydrogenase